MGEALAMIHALRIILLAAIVIGIAVTLRAAAVQGQMNTTRTVLGSQPTWCSPDQRFVRMEHTGWLPTENCFYPVAVPRVQR